MFSGAFESKVGRVGSLYRRVIGILYFILNLSNLTVRTNHLVSHVMVDSVGCLPVWCVSTEYIVVTLDVL